MAPGQHHNYGDEQEVEGAQGENNGVLPLQDKVVNLSLASLLPLLCLDSLLLKA